MDARAVPATAGSTAGAPPDMARRPTHFYVAYGLRIASDVELSDLVSGSEGGDVSIRMDRVDPVPDPGDGSPLWWRADGQSVRITFRPVGSFLVRDGREIVLDPVPDAQAGVLRQVILGPALAMLLTQRGLTTLHASAVDVGGSGVIFLGGAGSGKSTTAAAMHARGHRLIADDAVAVTGLPGEPLLPAGFPRLKLWPETADSLGVAAGDLTVLYPDLDKRGLPVPDGFATGPVRPTHAYVLADGPGVAIEQLSPAQATIELLTHTHGVVTLQGVDPSSQLRNAARLAEAIHVRRLVRPLALESLLELAGAIEADVRSGAPAEVAPVTP